MQVMLTKATICLGPAIDFIKSKKYVCHRTMSILFQYFNVIHMAESSASGQTIQSGHDLFINSSKTVVLYYLWSSRSRLKFSTSIIINLINK